VSRLLLFRESLPAALDFLGLVSPLLADDLGDLGVGEPRVLRDDPRLVVLAIKDEGCEREEEICCQQPIDVPRSLPTAICESGGDKELRVQVPGLRKSGKMGGQTPDRPARAKGQKEDMVEHVPLRGLGTLGAGVQRHMRSLEL